MSNEKRWTPGPWEVYADDEVFSRAAKTEAGYPVVVMPDSGVFEFEYGDTMPVKRQCRANAHLIAAAPELYEALEILLDNIGALSKPHELKSEGLTDEEAGFIWSALAKARGGQS